MKFDPAQLNKMVKEINDEKFYLREQVFNFLSKLKLKFKDGIRVEMIDPDNDFDDYKSLVDIYGIDNYGIIFDEDFEDFDNIDSGMEYDDICTDDLITIMEEVIETEEFKKKYIIKEN